MGVHSVLFLSWRPFARSSCERTCKVIHDDVMSHDYGIETPIVDAVYEVLYKNASPQEVVASLMNRDLKSEQL